MRGKVVVITGAASGIGRAASAAFSEAGATVCGFDLATGDEESVTGGVDVTSGEQVAAFMAKVVERQGGIDALVNSAGISSQGVRGPVHEMDDASWDQVIAVNLTGTFTCCRAVLPAMLENGGAIVNVASIMGLVAQRYAAAYVASKAGVVGLTRAMALEYAEDGIRVNALCPGYVETPMIDRHLSRVADPVAARAELEAAHPLGRMARPEEIAAAALWLASDAASFVTGAAFPVDGGYTAR